MPNNFSKVQPKALRAKDVASLLGIGVSTVWRWRRQGVLPQGVQLTARCTVWRMEDIESFLAGRSGQEGPHA
ncbi:MAG: AlpA family phage regulatory protein [Desulfovibrio sp.]|nr:AlpA family phage regulatory protein [Desulfovibrio sp.]